MNRPLLYLLGALLVVSPFLLQAQTCTTLGQTPSTAFPVCGTSVFTQNNVPSCTNAPNLFVPGCDPTLNQYDDVNPFYYRFKCYQTGTLGFTITPLQFSDDYDWQLYDITGLTPNEIFTNRDIIVAANWTGVPSGPTGASANGTNLINCGTNDRNPSGFLFSSMPTLQVNHEYLLMVSNYSPSQVGYRLSFSGGTAVITDPTEPKLGTAKADCNGQQIRLKLNKKVLCRSYQPDGSEFSLLPAVTTVIAAEPDSCNFGFDFDDITLTLAAPLPNGNYELVINNGTDNNTLEDYCFRTIPQGDKVPFSYFIPSPIFADSVGRPPCAPDSIKLYFPKRILCSSINSTGAGFTITGPTPVTITGARGVCTNDKTEFITVKFDAPIKTGGTYTLTLTPGIDVNPTDECGQPLPNQLINFTTKDTVSAQFNYSYVMGCQENNYTFNHNRAGGVTTWLWKFNTSPPITTPFYSIKFPATSTNLVSLYVSNGICKDTASARITPSNQVKASFILSDSILCPQDKLSFLNTSVGQVDQWGWQFGTAGNSSLQHPNAYLFPFNNRESLYKIRLKATNFIMNCSDSSEKIVKVLDHCLIEVPNAFTPNGDGLNDSFSPHNALKASSYSFTIFNRWGQLVYQTNNWMDRWDGRVNGLLQSAGVYVWKLSYRNRDTGRSVFKKGTVTLIR